MPIKGIDLSHNNSVTSFHDIVGAGYQFVFLKATEGTGFVDPCYADYYSRAREVGLLVGSYLFLRNLSGVQQAQFFVNNASIQHGDLLPVVDAEVPFPSVGAIAQDAAAEIKRLCGHYPILYSSKSFYEDNLRSSFSAATTLWVADYARDPGDGQAIWQKSESGTVPGVVGNCDINVYAGDSLEAIRILCA